LANFNKQDIAEVFKKLDLLDTLFPLTKSCEKKTMAVDDPHCKTCWWCLERQWGFNRFI
jgi:7-cyano-7-deazaguanine synthase in queuosine biosynthesis